MNGSTVAHELLAACLESPGKTQRSTEWVNQVLLSQTIEQGLLLREQSEALRRIENAQNVLFSYLTTSLKSENTGPAISCPIILSCPVLVPALPFEPEKQENPKTFN